MVGRRLVAVQTDGAATMPTAGEPTERTIARRCRVRGGSMYPGRLCGTAARGYWYSRAVPEHTQTPEIYERTRL